MGSSSQRWPRPELVPNFFKLVSRKSQNCVQKNRILWLKNQENGRRFSGTLFEQKLGRRFETKNTWNQHIFAPILAGKSRFWKKLISNFMSNGHKRVSQLATFCAIDIPRRPTTPGRQADHIRPAPPNENAEQGDTRSAKIDASFFVLEFGNASTPFFYTP